MEVVVVVDGTVVVELEVVVGSEIGNVASAPRHGFGWQVPAPMSMPAFLQHARGVLTRHFEAPLGRVRQH